MGEDALGLVNLLGNIQRMWNKLFHSNIHNELKPDRKHHGSR